MQISLNDWATQCEYIQYLNDELKEMKKASTRVTTQKVEMPADSPVKLADPNAIDPRFTLNWEDIN